MEEGEWHSESDMLEDCPVLVKEYIAKNSEVIKQKTQSKSKKKVKFKEGTKPSRRSRRLLARSVKVS